MMTEKIIIEMEVPDCHNCLFLNSSDTGENCKILKSEIQEDPWSNIGYQFGKKWRYKNCPLFHEGYLEKNCGIKKVMYVIEND